MLNPAILFGQTLQQKRNVMQYQRMISEESANDTGQGPWSIISLVAGIESTTNT